MFLIQHRLAKTCWCKWRNLAYYSTASEFPTTFENVYHKWVNQFRLLKIPEPEESAGYIIAHLLGKKTFSVVPSTELLRVMTQNEILSINKMCELRVQRMPVQYIIGEWDFCGMELKMRPPVFIPRPETEELADHVLSFIRNEISTRKSSTRYKVLEIGCGSGALTLALLKHLQSEPIEFTAVDAMEHAVRLTKDNSFCLGLNNTDQLKILQFCLGEKKDNQILTHHGKYDLIISNPPYIPTKDMLQLAPEIKNYEDEHALHGGQDGLDVINKILQLSRSILTVNGSIWLEVDESHPDLLLSKMKQHAMISYQRDIFRKPRFCHLKLKQTCKQDN